MIRRFLSKGARLAAGIEREIAREPIGCHTEWTRRITIQMKKLTRRGIVKQPGGIPSKTGPIGTHDGDGGAECNSGIECVPAVAQHVERNLCSDRMHRDYHTATSPHLHRGSAAVLASEYLGRGGRVAHVGDCRCSDGITAEACAR